MITQCELTFMDAVDLLESKISEPIIKLNEIPECFNKDIRTFIENWGDEEANRDMKQSSIISNFFYKNWYKKVMSGNRVRKGFDYDIQFKQENPEEYKYLK